MIVKGVIKVVLDGVKELVRFIIEKQGCLFLMSFVKFSFFVSKFDGLVEFFLIDCEVEILNKMIGMLQLIEFFLDVMDEEVVFFKFFLFGIWVVDNSFLLVLLFKKRQLVLFFI